METKQKPEQRKRPPCQNVVGPRVAALRRAQGMSQDALAARCARLGWDLTENGVMKIETQVRCVTDGELFKSCLGYNGEYFPDRISVVSARPFLVVCGDTKIRFLSPPYHRRSRFLPARSGVARSAGGASGFRSLRRSRLFCCGVAASMGFPRRCVAEGEAEPFLPQPEVALFF